MSTAPAPAPAWSGRGRFPAVTPVLALALALLSPVPAAAQDGPTANMDTGEVHWALSSFLGTGYYRVSGEREVFILDMPFSRDWREGGAAADGSRRPAITLDLPVTVGVHQLDFFDGLLDPENFGTLSFTPGVDVHYALTDRWVLRGYAHAGWGADVSGDEEAWIWDLGMKARYGWARGGVDWGVLGEAFHAGYNPDTGGASGLGGFGFGVDAQHPIAWRAADGGALDATWDLAYRWYGDALTFRSRSGQETRIDDEWRFSAGLVWRDRPLKAWFYAFDRFSIGYRLSSGGEFRGITFSVSAPLDR